MRFALAFLLCLLAAPEDPLPVDYSVLSGFDWTPGMELPAGVKELQGKKIGVMGFIRTWDGRREGINEFWLVDRNCDCQGAPKMNEVILCTLPEGKTISNDDSPIKAVGIFDAGEVKDGDYVTSIYRMKVSEVE